MEGNITAINAELEEEIWQNDNTDLFPGFIYQIVLLLQTDGTQMM